MTTVTKRLLAVAFALAVTVPMYADFASLVRAIDSKSGVKKVWIPVLGVARVAVRMVQPEGVRDFQLATFKGAERLDPSELHALMRTQIGAGFTPLVQAWSRRSGKKEFSFIYVRPHSSERVELVILARDDEDTVLVRVDVDANVIARELNEPRNVRRMAHR